VSESETVFTSVGAVDEGRGGEVSRCKAATLKVCFVYVFAIDAFSTQINLYARV
jgi:hypothetical protein